VLLIGSLSNVLGKLFNAESSPARSEKPASGFQRDSQPAVLHRIPAGGSIARNQTGQSIPAGFTAMSSYSGAKSASPQKRHGMRF
jgi:hypothetical protein